MKNIFSSKQGFFLILFALTACGKPQQNAANGREPASISGSSLNYTPIVHSSTGGNSNNGNTNGNTTPVVTEEDEPSAPTLFFEGEAFGYSKTLTFTVQTRDRLKIRIKANPVEMYSTLAGKGPHYSKLAVNAVVGTQDQWTSLLENGVRGKQEWSQVLDFSSAVPALTDDQKDDPEAFNTVTITIRKPNCDYMSFIRGYYWVPYAYCEKVQWGVQVEVESSFTKYIDESAE